ncbi:formylglycine-generating enzyme family protein [Sorangium sp. So ce363]|uniref:formylglycine-generating enzyme family protein n=1 Tax=Sorangium sp. So ce363 TaxID=3133304 RepID=UPI003F635AF0
MQIAASAVTMWTGACLVIGGCTAIVGVDKPYHLADGAGGGSGGGGGAETCTPEEVRCAQNRPQTCDEGGAWQDEPECPAEVPLCDDGRCIVPRSCAKMDAICGPRGDEGCCGSLVVPGGTFDRGDAEPRLATVSDLRLDRFEVTVGRFRAFLSEYPASWPAVGAGAHPKIPDSGWRAAWDANLPVDRAALSASLHCEDPYFSWTDEVGEHELLPAACVSWYVAFAFCAWDGGRLPTAAERRYAAAGGDEQRTYPWSSPESAPEPDESYAVYGCGLDGSCEIADLQPGGSRSPRGDGRWGHADLGGNVWEWVLDSFAADDPIACDDCAVLTPDTNHMIWGGGWRSGKETLLTSAFQERPPNGHFAGAGLRCARAR